MLKTDTGRWRLFTIIVFAFLVLLLGWQSDDAYHGYVMSKHLAEGAGLVYNVGERATASTCPLFTLIIAGAYFVTREMFFTSIAVCTIFSTLAYGILAFSFCRTKKQIIVAFLALSGSVSFMSYTTSGLENSLLFFLSALFLRILFKNEWYGARHLLGLALILSALAMARMDSVLLFVPVIVWAYLFRRDNVGIVKMILLGLLGLLPFILWEAFATFYFGFPFPNPAYVKLGTGISDLDYLKRGVLYCIYTFLNDLGVLLISGMFVLFSIISKKARNILVGAGVLLYFIYILRIGGDFMLGRHFTVPFFVSLLSFLAMENEENESLRREGKFSAVLTVLVVCSVVYSLTFVKMIGQQYLYGHFYSSSISDEREFYSSTTGLYNNLVSLYKTGRLCIEDTWNYDAPDDLRERGMSGGILENAAGILVYYNQDLYLNDTYCLGDPFLSKLPAVYDPNWRVGHLRREVPEGYQESVNNGDNEIKDPALHEYYDVIRLITRGKLTDKERLRAILDINLGRYDYLLKGGSE
ncbi:MAG: hypothetical protein K5985_06260 [Lachnospiraceae bacterium]|nr:hypothetical protein [Lachnospiraceae bacterium]